jgi:hypothetical protein
LLPVLRRFACKARRQGASSCEVDFPKVQLKQFVILVNIQTHDHRNPIGIPKPGLTKRSPIPRIKADGRETQAPHAAVVHVSDPQGTNIHYIRLESYSSTEQFLKQLDLPAL